MDPTMLLKLPKCSPESHYPFSCTPTEPETKQDIHPWHFCSPLTSSSWWSTSAKAPSSHAKEPQGFPPTKSLQNRSSCDNHTSTCSRGAAGWPGSMSHPRSHAVPQPWCTCAMQMDTERAAAAALCVLPACSLHSQFVCLPQPFGQDLWMSAAKNMEKWGKWRWKTSGSMCKEGRRNAMVAIAFHIHMVKSPFAAGWGIVPCTIMGTMLTSLNVSITLATPNPFSFSASPLSVTWVHSSHQALTWSMSIQREKPQSLETQSPSIQ